MLKLSPIKSAIAILFVATAAHAGSLPGDGLILEGPVGAGAQSGASSDAGMQVLGMVARIAGGAAGVNIPMPGLGAPSYQAPRYGSTNYGYNQYRGNDNSSYGTPPGIQALYANNCMMDNYGNFDQACVRQVNRKVSEMAIAEGRTFQCVGRDGRVYITQHYRQGCALSRR